MYRLLHLVEEETLLMTVRGDLTTCVDDQARRTKMQRTTTTKRSL